MADDKRFKLDEWSAQGPKRNILGAFSQKDGPEGAGAAYEGSAYEGAASGGASEAWSDAVTDAVELASKIISEQIELGRKVAGQLNNQVYGFGDFANQPQDLADSMFRSITELSSSWFKMMSDLSSAFVGTPRESNGTSGQSRTEDVRLDTVRHAGVTASLSGLNASSEILVTPLISDPAGLPPLTECTTSAYSPFITITIPEDQPAGLYFGAVFDRSQSRVAGSILVKILDSPQSGSSN